MPILEISVQMDGGDARPYVWRQGKPDGPARKPYVI